MRFLKRRSGISEKEVVCLLFLIPTHTYLYFRLYKRDERAVFLYVQENSDDFQMFFPSKQCRSVFHRLVQELTADQKGGLMDLESDLSASGPIQVISIRSYSI